ncbi:ABC transporter ATP-binding protein [Euzebya rosea]|uniref:ABC transporter ATP-binding protein n=1 Tax=Euzebya rosea TaxID=2052804 RepID=UPI000D3E86C7|nr:dipeptide ABC transporter ATP-binding protein [Euzebya rosea]
MSVSEATQSAPGPSYDSTPLLRVEGLVKHFPIKQGIVFKRTIGHVQAVDGVSFDLYPGETLGLVGESGSGKSTVARTLLRLHEPTAGKAMYEGEDLFQMSTGDMRKRRRDIQMIFQDPYASLNPRMTVRDIVTEGWKIHTGLVAKKDWEQRAGDLLERVGLNPDHINRYPHQFSGGQRQRIGVARALALEPKIIVADEPVSALDVSVQAQVINLLEEIQDEFNLSYIFIAHDLSVVRHIADRVAVMYLGRVVEIGTEDEIYERPTHPYTQALLSATPIADPVLARERPERILLQGDLPSPSDPPSGCRFRTRCWKVRDECANEDPALVDRFGHGHPSACLFAEEQKVLHK